jgi:hypothetical protein
VLRPHVSLAGSRGSDWAESEMPRASEPVSTVPTMERQADGICPECNEPAVLSYAQLRTEEDDDLIERLAGVECRTEGCTNFVAPPRIG